MSKKKIKRPQKYQKPKERTMKEWWQDQSQRTQKSIIYALVALAVVVVLALGYYYGVYDDGSLKVRRGEIADAQANWLIGRLNKGKNSEYYHVADVETPEGYTLNPNSAAGTSSSLRTDFTFNPIEDNGISNLYVVAVDETVSNMANNAHTTFASMTAETGSVTEVKEAATALGMAQYFLYQYSYEDDAGKTCYAQAMVFYAPCNYKNACVLVSANVTPETEEGFLPEDLLLDTVQKVLAENVTMM